MSTRITTAFFLLFLSTQLSATHNHSGEIVFEKTGGLGIKATVVTYTKASSVNADRDSLTICWGDGQCTVVARSNGSGELIGHDTKKNLYTGYYTYAAEGIYQISMTDQNRSGGIINVNPPSSDNIPFHLEALVRMLPDAATSLHSPVFLEAPLDAAPLYLPFVHVPNGFDADGDSLVYELAIPLAGIDSPVPNYSWPNQITPSPENQIFLDPATGKFTWDAPQTPGHYCIAIVVHSFRNGVLVEETRRDLFIEVEGFANTPPELFLTPDIQDTEIVEVLVGQTVQVQVTATDADPGQTLTLTATGGLFEDFFQEKAAFTSSGNSGVFTWEVKPEHVWEQPHQIVFKAKDDFLNDGYTAIRVVRFHVKTVSGVLGANPVLPGLSISPNPNSGVFNIELPETGRSGMVLHMVSPGGQILQKQTIQTGSRVQTIQTLDLPSGLYFLQLVADNKVWAVEKFVKQ